MRIVGLALVVATIAVGCTINNDEPEERRVALRALLESLDLDPRAGENGIRIGRTQVYSDYPYFTANGVLAVSRAVGVARAEAALEERGWEVFESGEVEHFLGWCVRARKGSMIAAVSVGWSDLPSNNVYPRLPGRLRACIGRSRGLERGLHRSRPPEVRGGMTGGEMPEADPLP